MPTPVKYFSSSLRAAFAEVETEAKETLLSMLPDEMSEVYRGLLYCGDERERRLVKAADVLDAYIKCVEELKAGNSEFEAAEKQTRQALVEMQLPCLDYFLAHFLDSFRLTLDELE